MGRSAAGSIRQGTIFHERGARSAGSKPGRELSPLSVMNAVVPLRSRLRRSGPVEPALMLLHFDVTE